MTISVFTPSGPFVIGPGAPIIASSDLLGLANPPYHWSFDFTTPDSTAHWLQTSVITSTAINSRIVVQWNPDLTPSTLLTDVHARPSDSIRLEVRVVNDAGQNLDTPVVLQVPWDPVAWLHANQTLWANNIVSRVSGGGSTDQLDRIESAVYQVFPHA